VPRVAGDPPRPVSSSAFGVVAAASGTSLLTRKYVLVAFSHAIEEECRTGLDGAHVFGGFQRAAFFEPARATWSELATGARSTHVFADFGHPVDPVAPSPGVPVLVAPAVGSPERTEWVVVVDRPHGSVALAARERPGQPGVRDHRRLFDSAWTTDPVVVRTAALLLARAARAAGSPGADQVADELRWPRLTATPDVALRERLLDRLLDLIDS